MKTKKTLLVALALMCAMAISSSCVACGSDDDDGVKTFSYNLYSDGLTYFVHNLDPEAYQNTVMPWLNSIMTPYRTALGTSSDLFTRTGKQAECDQQVFDACKRAEETVKDIRGGSTTVYVVNNTVGKIVYSYQVQP